MNDLKLNNGQIAKFLRVDYWSRPVYELECGIKVCCVELNGTYLHTMTSDGEPIAPLKAEYQPVGEIPKSKVDAASDIAGGNLVPSNESLAFAKNDLSDTAPEGCDLKVGDVAIWVNDYGVKWVHRIIGFAGNCVHFGNSGFLIPHKLETVTKCDEAILDRVQ